MRVEDRYFGASQVRITVHGKPEGDLIAYVATASINGEPVRDDAGHPLELTASQEERAFDRMVQAVGQRLGRP